MELAKVLGTVVATRKVENVDGFKFLVIQPVDHEMKPRGEPIIAADGTAQAGPGELVYWVQGREAALAFPTWFNPCDAGIVGIVDDVHVVDKGQQK